MGEVVQGNFQPTKTDMAFVEAIDHLKQDIHSSVEMFTERGSDTEKFAWLFVFMCSMENLRQHGADVDYLRGLINAYEKERDGIH